MICCLGDVAEYWMLSNVIWLADTNYRIDMDNMSVRSMAEADDFDALVAMDQLTRMMDARLVFAGYK